MIKVSIVTVTFNCENVVEETIQSVVNQTYPNIEYILIDGGSEDETVTKIRKYEAQIMYWESKPDKGIFDAMNKSLKYVTGDYVIFMNAGDRFVNNHIISDIFTERSYGANMIYGDIYVQNEMGYLFRKANAIYLKKPTAEDMVFKSQGICHQAIFTKSSILKRIKFDLSFPLGADYDTTAKVYYTGNHQLVYTGFPVAIFDDRNGGASHNQIIRVLKERCEMFHYHPGVKFYCIAYSRIIISKFKMLFEKIFGREVRKYKSRKYLRHIE